MHPLRSALRRSQRKTGAELRPLIVLRSDIERAVSSAIQHLTGEAGFFARHPYDLRRWACTFARRKRNALRFFTALGGRSVPLAGFPPDRPVARLLEAGLDRPFPDITTPIKNASAEKFREPPILARLVSAAGDEHDRPRGFDRLGDLHEAGRRDHPVAEHG